MQSRWKPIETAPKDGTPILVWTYDSKDGTHHLQIVDWDPLGYWGTTYGGSGWRDDYEPTHWMPLPKGPR